MREARERGERGERDEEREKREKEERERLFLLLFCLTRCSELLIWGYFSPFLSRRFASLFSRFMFLYVLCFFVSIL